MLIAVRRVAGALFAFVGIVWFLQGIGILPGSFMTGQLRWAVYGAVAATFGILLLFGAKRPPRE